MTNTLMTNMNEELLKNELQMLKDEHARLAHVAAELVEGIEVIINRVEPNIRRIDLNLLRRPNDRSSFRFALNALKEVQTRSHVLLEGLAADEGQEEEEEEYSPDQQ